MAVNYTDVQKTEKYISRTNFDALEMAAGLREPTDLMDRLLTEETGHSWTPPTGEVVLSFSGGVADSIGPELP